MVTRILVIDDNRDILEMVEMALSYEDFTVHAMEDTQNLLTTMQSFNPDLILLDYVLENDNGGEVCRRLKSHPHFNEIPVIIYTAYLVDVTNLYAQGCDAVIKKPFDLTELTSTIRELLQNSV